MRTPSVVQSGLGPLNCRFYRALPAMKAKPSELCAMLLFALGALVVGVVETFVCPKATWFGEVMLLFAVALAVAWWAGRSGNRRVRLAADTLAGIAVCLGLYDIIAH